jgi:SAM-dependent methyltransferase
MDKIAYEVEGAIEENHWWFVGRRRLFRHTINKLALPKSAAILDVGTSTGTNLRMLREMGFENVRGLDFSEEAIRWCEKKGLGQVEKGDICDMPFGVDQFDLILATDIVEHVNDDARALQEIGRVLKPCGRAIITVPAFQGLWGAQDDISHHKRRYLKRDFLGRLRNNGLSVDDCFYFNFILFVPIWLARRVIMWLDLSLESENQVNSPLMNFVMKAIFTVDVIIARTLRPPFGVSIFALVGEENV